MRPRPVCRFNWQSCEAANSHNASKDYYGNPLAEMRLSRGDKFARPRKNPYLERAFKYSAADRVAQLG